jgi:hypothetical protein
MNAARIVTLDIETSPILAYVWGLFKQFVGLNQIVSDWSIISFSYKWLDKHKVHHFNTGGKGIGEVRNDRQLLLLLWEVLDKADIVVAQNGVKFDVKKINARFIELGLPPPTPYKVVDTMLQAKAIAAFTSNKLAWLSEILTDQPKSRHEKFPGFELWTECLADNPEAWEEMRLYNDQDIRATERVYLMLRPYMVGHPNVAAYNANTDMQCPKCSSTNLQRRGLALTQAGQYQRYRCGGCGGWARTRYTENPIEKRRSLLMN